MEKSLLKNLKESGRCVGDITKAAPLESPGNNRKNRHQLVIQADILKIEFPNCNDGRSHSSKFLDRHFRIAKMYGKILYTSLYFKYLC